MITNKEREELYSALYRDIKGSKIKSSDWITIAKKTQKLVKSDTMEDVAQKLGVTPELIRSIITLLKLPHPVQRLIKQRKILYDAARRLTFFEAKKAIEVANVIAGLTSHQQREVINYARKFPNSGLGSFKKRVSRPKMKAEKVYVTILPLRKENYELLATEARHQNVDLERVILNIIEEWKRVHAKAGELVRRERML